MRRTLAALASLAATMLFACTGSSPRQEACAVYRSFFAQLPGREQQALEPRSWDLLATHHVAMTAPTRFERGAGLLAPDPGGAPPEYVNVDTDLYFAQVHTEPTADISRCFHDDVPRFVGPSEDVLHMVDDPNSDIFAVWWLSPVAISPDGRNALVVGDFFCGGLCGGGAYYLFEKSEEGWTLLGHRDLWIY